MIDTTQFIHSARKHGFDFYTGVPCSYLKPFINYVINGGDELQYVAAANEGDAVAIASGAALEGGRSVAMFQNSGLGNAVNPLTSLNQVFQLPIMLIVTWRGAPGQKDEPQHELMGQITTDMLDVMEIPWELFPREESAVEGALHRAVASMDRDHKPYALVMKKGSVAPVELTRRLNRAASAQRPVVEGWRGSQQDRVTRSSVLQQVLENTDPHDSIVVATTGFTGRELFAQQDRANHFYMVGSMGCASSFGLGVALRHPHKKIIVVEGDGAVLMRMGALATTGFYSPENLVHVVLDNEVHESTGGQDTISSGVSFAAIAQGCGYSHVYTGDDPRFVVRAIHDAGSTGGTQFVHLKTQPGVPEGLPRPTVTPVEVRRRLAQLLAKAA
ncbi:MAG: phosphonopyruvate decarboxylase [Pirellulaceae bacterium]|jgi:phosphonopyruvate decarboxylase|nr:phosphonopyruvate decarboxylase [Pirellulaceae bacterium]